MTDVVSAASQTVADAAFSAIAHDFGQAADSVVNWLWRQISAATAVSLGGPGFGSELAITGAIAVTVGIGLFTIQVIVAVLRREPGGLARAGRGLLVAFVAGGVSIAAVDVSLAAVDSLAAGIVHVATGGTIAQMGAALLGPAALSSVSNGAVVILLALVMVVASTVVWAALMVRKLLIIVAAVFAPIAFAGSLAEITSAWVRRWIEAMAALIFSKVILVIIFSVGVGVLTGGVGQSPQHAAGGATQSLTQTVTGALILVMAGFSPWLAVKLVHFAGDSFHAVHGQAVSTGTGVQAIAAAPRKLQALRPPGRLTDAPSSAGDGPGSGGPGVSGPSGGSSGLGAGAARRPIQPGQSAAAGSTGSAAGAVGAGAAAAGAAVAVGQVAVSAAKAAAAKAAEHPVPPGSPAAVPPPSSAAPVPRPR